MKIFITGIAGFLGSHLAKRLKNLGHEVFGNDNLILGELENLPKNIKFYKTDCCDYNQMVKILKVLILYIIVQLLHMKDCLFFHQTL